MKTKNADRRAASAPARLLKRLFGLAALAAAVAAVIRLTASAIQAWEGRKYR